MLSRSPAPHTLEPPELFYKYAPIGPWLPDLLSGESLKFSSRTSFNDPFDSRPSFQISANTYTGNQYIHGQLKSKHLSPAARLQAAGQIRAQNKRPRMFGGTDVEQLLNEVGILSLTTTWNNILMWSHYADGHKGICFAFRSDVDVFETALEVKYDSALPIIRRPDDGPDIMLEKTFLWKSRCWLYEDEWRAIKKPLAADERRLEFQSYAFLPPEQQRVMADQCGHGLYKFQKEAISSITLGMSVSEQQKQFVWQSICAAALNIQLYQCEASTSTYAVNRKQVPVL